MTNNWTESPTGTPGSDSPKSPHVPAASFFDGVRRIGIVRADQGRMAAGVCAGIARRTGVSVGIVRLVAVLAALLGAGVLAYGLAWFFLPQEDGRIHAQQLMAGQVSAGAVGAFVVTCMGVGDSGFGPAPFQHSDGAGWCLLVVGIIALVIYRRRARRMS